MISCSLETSPTCLLSEFQYLQYCSVFSWSSHITQVSHIGPNDPVTLSCYRAGEGVKRATVRSETFDQPAGVARKVFVKKRKPIVESSQEFPETKPGFPDFDRGELLYIYCWRQEKGASKNGEFIKCKWGKNY